MEKVFFNNALKRISIGAFFDSGLKNVVIPDSVEYIGEKAFGHCLKMKYVVVPDSVEYIGENAFTNGKIYCESLSKPEGWHDNFISNKAVVLWGNEWEYDENGEPRAK